MNKAGRKILFVLGSMYVLAFLALLGWSYCTAPPIRIAGLRRDWIIGNALVLFAHGLVPLHVSALLCCFSVFFRDVAGSGRRQFFVLLRFMGLCFLVLVLLYSVLLEAGLPLGLRMREDATGKIRQADDLRMKARAASARGQLREARRDLQYAVALFPADEELRYELDLADRAVQASGQADRKRPVPEEGGPLLLNMSFDEFLSRAKNAFDREDYISAEYYANFALRMDQKHPQPKRIIAEARERLEKNINSRETRADMDFFRRKQTGADMLSDGDCVEAYRYLLGLQRERPDDPDVRHYLRLAYAKLQKASFLLSEIPLTAMAEGRPAREGIVFINSTDKTGTVFLYIGQVVATGTDYYALDIECIKIAPEGGVLFHFGAPYGKLADGILLMRCVEEDDGHEFTPEYYAGRQGGLEANQLTVAADPQQLLRMNAGVSDYADVPLWSLWQTARTVPLLGVNPYPVYMAFFSRLFLPFAFFVLSFLAAAYGLRFRSRYAAAPPVLCFFFLPFLPLLMILVFHLYVYALYAVQGFLLTALGFSASLGVFCAVQGILIFIALLVFSRQFRQ